ncbi:MAG: S9 family peptidase [Myxococcota bacterium]|nr:S9 family peptidase [Myxococcota bacterium]
MRSKTISPEAVLTTKSFHKPQISNDGKWLVVEIEQLNPKENIRQSHLYKISTQDQVVEQLTFSGQRNHSPRWSPDGQKIAFVRKDGVSSQIYVLTTGIPEPRKITSLPGGAYEPKWSAFGDRILFRSYVEESCETPSCNLEVRLKYPKSKAKSYEEPLFRHWDRFLGTKRSQLFTIDLTNMSEPVKLRDFSRNVPPIFLKSFHHYALMQSGQILYVSRSEEKASHPINHDLFLFNPKDNNSNQITHNRGWDGNPLVSPSQRYIAFLSQSREGFESDRATLKVYDTKTSTTFSVTHGHDISLEEIVWSSDEKGLFFTTHRLGFLMLGYISLTGENLEYIIEDRSVRGLTIGPNNNIFFEASRIDSLPEIYRYEKSSRELSQISHINKKQQEKWVFGQLEKIRIGEGDEQTHGFVVFPPGYNPYRQYSLLVLLHGGPRSAWTNQWHHRWNPQVFAAQGYVVALPNPKGSIGYGQEFSDAVRLNWGKASMGGTIAFTQYLQKRSDIRDDKTCAAGASFGGYLTHFINTRSQLFQCFISHAGIFNLDFFWSTTDRQWFPEWEFGGVPWKNKKLYKDLSPSSSIEGLRTPTLLLHGQKDFRVDVSQSIAAFTSLRRKGIPSRLVYFPDEGHWITRPQNLGLWYEEVHTWLAKYLR